MIETTIIKSSDKAYIKAVAELAEEIWTEHYIPIVGKQKVEYMLANFQSEKAIQKQITEGLLYYLVMENNINIGYIAFISRDNSLFISKIYLKSIMRGKGIGKQLLSFAENFANEQNLSKLTLYVNKNNLNSIKAYEKFGFIITEQIVKDIGNGYVMDDYIMTKGA